MRSRSLPATVSSTEVMAVTTSSTNDASRTYASRTTTAQTAAPVIAETGQGAEPVDWNAYDWENWAYTDSLIPETREWRQQDIDFLLGRYVKGSSEENNDIDYKHREGITASQLKLLKDMSRRVYDPGKLSIDGLFDTMWNFWGVRFTYPPEDNEFTQRIFSFYKELPVNQ